jgi:hypothetical protein
MSELDLGLKLGSGLVLGLRGACNRPGPFIELELGLGLGCPCLL